MWKRFTYSTKIFFLFFQYLLLSEGVCLGQVSITSAGTAYTENFSIGTSATATLPSGFKVNTSANWSTGTTATTQAAGTTGAGVLNGSSTGGVYNFANGITGTSTERALGFLTSGGFASPRSIIFAFTNNTGNNIVSLDISFDYEKYRSGTRAFDWTFFHGATATSVATAAALGNQSYTADANNTTISNPPSTINKSFSITGLSISNGTTYYLCWTYTGSGGSTNAQGLGIDNFSITLQAAASYTSTLASSATLTEPATISSLNTTFTGAIAPQLNAVANFDFNVVNSDATAIQFSQLVLNADPGNGVTSWADALQEAQLSDGTNVVTTTSITSNTITFASLPNTVGNIGHIPSGSTKTYTLKIRFGTAMGGTAPTTIDGQDFVFVVDNSSFTFIAGGLASTQSVGSGDGKNTVAVVASMLAFVTQPTTTLINTTMSPSPTVQAIDANGNRDLGYTSNISLTSTGTLNASPQLASPASGLASFNVFHTVSGTGLILMATSGGLASAASNTFDILLSLSLEPGDIAILGFNVDRSGEDEIIIVFLKDVQNGTVLHVTDNAFGKCPTNNTNPTILSNDPSSGWGISEGWISLTYSGASPFPAGQTLTFRVNGGAASVVAPTSSGWAGTSASPTGQGSFNLNAIGEQIFFLAGGTPGGPSASTATSGAGTYTGGRFLYGFNTKSNIWTPQCANAAGGGTQNSAKPANFDCYLVYPTSQADYNAYTGDLSPATKSTWIGRIRNPANWTGYASSANYTAYADPTFTDNTSASSGRLLTINSGGFTAGVWTGTTSTDWYECSNWQNLRIPDQNTNVNVSGTPSNNPKIDITSPYATYYSSIAQCFDLNISSSVLQIEGNSNNRLDVYNNLTISGTGSIDMDDGTASADGQIRLAGNWTNQLGSSNFMEGDGTIVFNGTTPQTISSIGVSGEDFNNLTLDNAAGVNLLSPVVVNTNLTFNNGLLTLGDYNLSVGLTASATITGADASKYIVTKNNALSGGYLYRYVGASNVLFPIGTATAYNPAILNNAGTAQAFRVRVFNKVLANKTTGAALSTDIVNRTWFVDPTSSNPNLTLTLQWNASEELSGFVRASSVIFKNRGIPGNNNWIEQSLGARSVVAAPYTVSTSGINSFSGFTIGTTAVPLPIRLLSFTAQNNANGNALLQWVTASEDNNKLFEIQKSPNGLDFNSIAFKDGAGYSNQLRNYTFEDNQFNASSYYRLKQIDGDNKFTLSDMVYLEKGVGKFQVYPNPIDETALHFNLPEGYLEAILSNTEGKILYQYKGNVSDTEKALHQYLWQSPHGVYLIQVKTENRVYRTLITR